MNYLYPLNAIHSDGHVLLLYTADDVSDFIRKYGRWSDQRVTWYYVAVDHVYREQKANGWIVRDDAGKTVKFDDVHQPYDYHIRYNKRMKQIRDIAEKGLPIPHTGCAKAGWKMNHTAKKNSGATHRNRNRSRCEYDRIEYGIKNPYGKVKKYEHW